MLAGVTAPTEGRITVHGRVAPLISVGVGFHPELTGRENINVNAAILGLSREEVDERVDDIVNFAEVGEFIDTPVKFYSSGMFVRLGFSVSVLAEPDVLLVDEVLAVGDMAFQINCFDRIEELRAAGTTIVIVTHNLNAVRRLCPRTLVVHAGALRHDGATVDAISLYHELLGQPADLDEETTLGDTGEGHSADIESIELLGPDGKPTRHAEVGTTLTVETSVRMREHVPDVLVGLVVFSEGGVHVYGEHWPLAELTDGRHLGAGDRVRLRFDIDAALATGSYSLQIGLASLSKEQIAAPSAPVLFFTTGRARVRGIVDLGGRSVGSSLDANDAGRDGASSLPVDDHAPPVRESQALDP
jgi:ABC-type polysaccharide/polyol phosphate transport system ATPase subunit